MALRTSRTKQKGAKVPAMSAKNSHTGGLSSYQTLAEYLRRRILDGNLSAGTILPSERNLAEQTGLSRASIREALRVLEADGLVHPTRGRGGGSVVSLPNQDTIVKSIKLFVRGQRLRMRDVVETRLAIEPILAGLAATNRTIEDIERLREINAEIKAAIDDVPRFLACNVMWHCAIGTASHNALLSTFMVTISELVYQGTAQKEFLTDKIRRSAIGDHAKVLKAIIAQDSDAAIRTMREHISGHADTVHTYEFDELELGKF